MNQATSTATVILNAKNNTGPAFGGIFKSLGGIGRWFQNSKLDIARTTGQLLLFGNQTGKSKKGFEELQGAIERGNARALLSFTALTSAVGVATNAFGLLGNAFGQALERQGEVLNSTIIATKTLGLTQQQAAGFVENFNKQVAILGRDLPTSAEKISAISRTIIDDYAIALKQAGASTQQINDILVGSSSKIALLSELSGTNIADTQSAIIAYLSGSVGVAGLDRYRFFAANPFLRSSIISGAEQKGENLTTLSAFDRIKLLNEALDKSLTDQDIETLKGLSKSKISSFMDRLFDPETGIFSIQRDLDPKLPGYQSVFTSLERTLDLFIGENGLLFKIGKLLGIPDDAPLKLLKHAVDSFNEFIEGIIKYLDKLPKLDFWKFDLGQLSPGEFGSAIGKFFADAINLVVNGILAILTSIDYGVLIGAVFSAIGSFLANLDWKVYAIAAAAIIFNTLIPILTFAVTVLIQVLIGQLLTALLGPAVAGLLLPIIMPIILALGGAIILLIVGLIIGVVAIGKFIFDNWDVIVKKTKEFFKWLIDGVQRLFDPVKNFFGDIKKWLDDFGNKFQLGFNRVNEVVVEVLVNIVQTIDGMIRSAIAFVQSLWNQASSAIANAISSATSGIIAPAVAPVATVADAVTAPSSNPVVTIAKRSAVSSIPIIGPIVSGISTIRDVFSSKYQGHIPSAASGLMGAIASETKNKPFGADIAIANTSETILTPEMLANLVQGSFNLGASSRGGGNIINIASGAIALVLPAGTPQEIAMQALRIIEDKLFQELDAVLG